MGEFKDRDNPVRSSADDDRRTRPSGAKGCLAAFGFLSAVVLLAIVLIVVIVVGLFVGICGANR